MIQHIKSYKSLEIEVDGVKNTKTPFVAKDKGKQKEIGIQIIELAKVSQTQNTISNFDV